MIEFGAGGTIVHNDSETAAPGTETTPAEGAAAEGTTDAAAGPPATEGAPAQAPPIAFIAK